MAFTFFFRDRDTLEHLREQAMPTFAGRRFIDIWDAGCAMGPEPYTLAIMFRESMSQYQFRNVRLYATDIDEAARFGDIVKEGIYPWDQIQRIPDEIRTNYFALVDKERNLWQIRDDVRQCIHFGYHDLLTLQPVRTQLSIIVCKNVLLHFTAAERAEVVRMFHRALDPGGFFVTEHTQKLPEGTERLFRQVVPNARVYQRVEAAA